MLNSAYPVVLYQDPTVAITQDQVQIKNYSYPLPFTKKVDFSHIISVDLHELQESLRWGYNKDKSIWFSLDDDRFVRKKYICLRLDDQECKVGFTPKNPDKVFSILQTKLKSQKVKQNVSPKINKKIEQTYDKTRKKIVQQAEKVSQKDKELGAGKKKPLQEKHAQKANQKIY